MKIRTDFVTNSSSSSYIISRNKIGENATVHDLHTTVLGFYKELSDKNKLIIKLAKAHGLRYSGGKLTDTKGNRMWFWNDNEYPDFQKAVLEKTGIGIRDHYSLSYSFCEDEGSATPNNYYDVEIPKMDAALDKDSDLCIFVGEGWRVYLLGWYFSDCRINWEFNWDTQDPDGLRWQYNDWSQFNWHRYDEDDFDLCEDDIGKTGRPLLNYEKVCKRCEKHGNCTLAKHMDVNGYTLHSAAEYLGEFVITGWDGSFPRYVDKRLKEISNYACNHMG
jgi:hypothetical protein